MLLKLLGLPFSLPAAGVKYCFHKVLEMAETEMTDVGPIKEELLLLQTQLEEGEISEEEYTAREAVVLARLREIREYRKALAERQMASRMVEGNERKAAVIEMPTDARE